MYFPSIFFTVDMINFWNDMFDNVVGAETVNVVPIKKSSRKWML